MTHIPPDFAFWLFWTALPVALFAIWDDLAHLKIRNGTVLITLAIFLILGLWFLPLERFALQFLVAMVLLALFFTAFVFGQVPAGDAKFLAAISPYFYWEDWRLIAFAFCSVCLLTLLCVFLVRFWIRSHWASFQPNAAIPLGVPLALVLLGYLGASAFEFIL